jgi:N-acetylneuraminate lyase
MNRLVLRGLIAAPHTPMLADGALHLPVIEQQVEMLLEGGVSGAFVCGTTGESASLSTTERMQVAARWVEVAPPTLPVIVHVGHPSAVESRALAAHAQQTGAAAISALAPYFFRPRAVPELVEFCTQIAAAAPALPFYFYHLPSITGVTLSVVDFIRQAREKIPTFAGIKYTHDDLMEFGQCLRLTEGAQDILFGRDALLLYGLVAGAKGAVGSTYNYAAPVYRRLIAAVEAGDLALARDCEAQAVRLAEVLRRYGEIPTAKAIMAMIGIPCGPARTPLPRLVPGQIEAIFDELANLDIFVRPLRKPG